MLEARNLKKEYKTKDSPIVKALDDVSVKFEETGMVFILGKSGSGKSTLLNVLGGLDSYDSGEVIVKGKSSKDFSGADFDSYRNTFIGFIFQEYNILEEFTVSKNIGLALELQGKKADKAAINDLMEQVDLKGYGKRKPNTLSGGQKQRVAIARALVKNPEIIMADEPTGALDSNTGRQVLDTLKKLSKTKLVLIVSHDREFAERYGDRIIELADGKIISDIVKYKSEPKVSDGFEIVDDKILTIKKGTKLDATKSKTLKEFIEKHDEDIIVSVDEKANKEFKKFAMIDYDGNKESFKNTENLNIKEYDPKKFKLIKSKLPGKDSFKMGASGLKSKPVRLVFTIILSAIAFALFGLADTMGSYNKVDNTIKSIMDSGVNYASFSKEIKSSDGDYSHSSKLSDADFTKLNNDLPGFTFIPVFDFGKGYSSSFSNNIYSMEGNEFNNKLYVPEFYGGVEITNDNVSKFGTLTGNLPTSDTEIVVTKYVYDMFKLGGYKSNSESTTKVEIKNENDLIGKTIKSSDTTYTITGILDTNADLSRYEKMKEDSFGSNNMQDFMTSNEFSDFISNSYHGLAYFKEGYFNRNIKEGGVFSKINNSDSIYGMFKATKPTQNDNNNNYEYIAPYTSSMNNEIIWKNGDKTSLQNNEVVLSSNIMNGIKYTVDGVKIEGYNLISNYKSSIFNAKFNNKLEELGITKPSEQEYLDTWRILNYFGNFNTGNYEYNTDSSNNDWESENSNYCQNIYDGSDECETTIYLNGTEMHLIYNKNTNIVSLNGVRDFEVVDNKVTINNIEFTKKVEYGTSIYFVYNYSKAEFIQYYGEDLTDTQKEELTTFFKNFSVTDIFGTILNIETSAKFNELLSYRTSVDGLNESLWNTNNYKDYLLSKITGNGSEPSFSHEECTVDEKEFILNKKKELYSVMIEYMSEESLWIRTNVNYNYEEEYTEYKVVGIYLGKVTENASKYSSTYGIISNTIYNKFSENLGGVYNFAISPLDPNNSEQVKAIVEYTYGDHGKTIYSLNNNVMSSISQVNELIEMLSKVFLYVGIGFAVFASLLLLNFITISISYKKREIGVLRAIGARGIDVFRIFFNEAFIIAFINFVLAFGGCFAVCIALNSVMRNNYGVLITILNIGIRQVLLMFAVSVLVAFISAFLPVNKIARKKPIDAIRNS